MDINLITLGCSKNLVDSEKLLGQLRANGHTIFHNADHYTECVIINSCGFILDAKTESLETVLEYIEAKKDGFVDKVYLMGCLSERYKDSLKDEIPELDGFFGVNDQKTIIAALQGKYYAGQYDKRVLTTPTHYAYLKISEGCNRNCAFCAIPEIRGKQISISIGELVEETKFLASQGVKELILIAQDLTSYGSDIYRKKSLPELLSALVEIEGIEWIRLHYNYPLGFPTEEIVSLMKKHRKICRYLDIPVQHADDKILKLMNRGHEAKEIYDIINFFRTEIPEISIRTTLITGFPGEGKKEFEKLKEFVIETKFDRLGVFNYSHEDKTPAWDKLRDTVPAKTKIQRSDELMKIQEHISFDKNYGKIGSTIKVIIDSKEGAFFIARSEFDSPEVDNEVLIPVENYDLKIGNFYDVKVFDALEFDLYARPV